MVESQANIGEVYERWFLDYASYVILERAVPAVEDGLKPVQRRILHAMREMEDGRFHKVANIIGQAMQYHPHGDASIGEALVNLGQKNLLIDTQGNWGDVNTGDGAAAARYIEARLSKFALEVVFNPQTTTWQQSYDGRKREPVTLPIKFPLLLAQGAEGIAVGLATKIMPHNFIELIEASIEILKGKPTQLLPDFPTGGMADFSEYRGGLKGGRIRLRAVIEEYDKKTLVIKNVPYGVTTTNLIDSIIKANETGKIKIKKITDNTAKEVEILVHLNPGSDPQNVKKALYAFTNCEVSISPNACVIIDEKPVFVDVNEILRISTQNTLRLLEEELRIRRAELLEKILYSSLEKIFIENRIYRQIEECETWEDVLATIDQGLEKYKKQFYRTITQEDILKLTEIRIKRISKFDAFKADEAMRKFEEELTEVEDNLANSVRFAIRYFKELLKKYGTGKERKTQIEAFSTIDAASVINNNLRLYVNREEGFIGYGLKKHEFVCDCSELDEILVLRRDGKVVIKKIAEKVFAGKDIIYLTVLNKHTKDQFYNLIYRDGKTKKTFAKRFQMQGAVRDKEYDLTKRSPQSEVLYVSISPTNKTEFVVIELVTSFTKQDKTFEFDFSKAELKSKSFAGIQISKYPIESIETSPKSALSVKGVFIWHPGMKNELLVQLEQHEAEEEDS